MIGSKVEYVQAYTELNCLLRYFPKQYINKLPEKLIKFIGQNSSKQFEINVDYKSGLDKLNLCKKTYEILAVLKYNYWSTEEEKEHIREKLSENEKAFQNELNVKYNIDSLFKNRFTQIETNEKKLEMIEYKEPIFIKLVNFIRNFFGHNKYK